jgi:hypothetical protein
LQESDALLTFAELGVGLGGFASIFLALTRRDGRLARSDAYRVRWMLINSLGAAGLALVPVTLHSLGLEPPLLWRLASVLHLITMLVGTVPVALLQGTQLGTEERAEMNSLLQIFGWFVAVTVLLAQGLNTIAWPFGPEAGPYMLSTALMLFMGGVHFIGLLFNRLL